MSRYCGEQNPDAILKAAEHWKSAALLGAGSVLLEKPLWTRENLEAIDKYYVLRPDEGAGRFLDKLEEQLTPTESAVKQLVAEMLWLMYLCPSSINPSHKRNVIARVWSWSGETFPSESRWLKDDVLAGVGSAGPGFNTNQWRELVFLNRLLLRFRGASPDQQRQLLASPWQLADWLGQVEDARSRQFRHMLLFLLFPDEFERIFGQRDRRSVAVAFSGHNAHYVNKLEPAELDLLLRETRANLEKEYGTRELDYYVAPLAELWQRTTVSTVAGDITPEHVLNAIADIERDGVPSEARSTKYDLIYSHKRYPPKLVMSLAAGHATGEALDRSSFSGGDDSTAFEVLRRLGLFIEPKNATEMLVKKFLEQASRGGLETSDYPKRYCGLTIKVSFGRGNTARIPWIAFLAEGEEVSEGIYPVFLFFREQRALALCYGVSETNSPARTGTCQ